MSHGGLGRLSAMKEKAKQIRGDSGGGLVLMDKKGKGKK